MNHLFRFALPICLLCGPAAHAAEQDALSIDANIQARHLPYGTILDPVLSADQSQVVSYTRCGDSAIWTGHYLAAEAFRYKVTGAADALANVNAALNGIRSLVDVTGNDVLARCALPVDSPYAPDVTREESAHGIYAGTLNGQPWVWIGDTSRDQYAGVFFGLAVAFDMVSDQKTRDLTAFLATRLLDHLLHDNWNIVLPDGTITTTFLIRPDQQLTLLQIGRHINGGRFGSRYSSELGLAPTVPIPVGIDAADEYDSYFKFNLDFINLYNLIRMQGSGFSKFFYNLAYDALHSTTAGDSNAFFNLIDRALKGPNSKRDAETVALLDGWLQRPRLDVYLDWTDLVQVCGGHACTPLPIQDRITTDFVWQRSPFQLAGGGAGNIEGAGIDYILPYWMARFYGLLKN
jgi:hypothetical protein